MDSEGSETGELAGGFFFFLGVGVFARFVFLKKDMVLLAIYY